jgi:outer membrane protein OmpA-like peptidoglycan-associated protein
LSIAATVLRNGRVDFTDHFVQPHYSAQLTELQGQVGRLDSRLKEMAAISLRGRAAGTALLDIHGQVNPLAHPPELDIKAQATELELAPLSPYAIRYAGYGIERGKLTVNLAYQVDPTGQLQASNQIVLNQLTFGDKVDSPTATNLPVRLAVSLLKDRNGVIDINLPVSGSLQDPQFSVGGIVFKLIVNLVGKALSAPFALLSGGDDHDISLVEFEPGTARITTNGKASLERVAAALADRPSLHMTVAGVADPAQERDALARALLEERLRTEQRRVRLHANGASATPAESPAAVAEIPMPPDERAMLLQSVYRQTSLPDKPRNLIGMVRALPAAEAEQRLLAASRVTEDAMRQLALQRGLAVRGALTAHGLSSDRLFIAAPRLRAATEAETAWTPRVELSLAAH